MLMLAFGTRPEWIKIKPVIRAINGIIPYKVLFTGQHPDLIDKDFWELNCEQVRLSIEPCNYSFNRLDDIIAATLTNLQEEYIWKDVSAVLIQGDTTSALAVALASFHRQIQVIHLEAGLRSFDLANPFPEEFNRRAISSLTSIHLCPTEAAEYNVICANEVLASRRRYSKYYVVGNTVLDNLVGLEPVVEDIVLVTLHRRENKELMPIWLEMLDIVATEHPELSFILPVHANMRNSSDLNLLKARNIIVRRPLDHTKCIDIIRRCKFVITDSGGLQEESAFLKKKCIVCRKTTERPEGLGVFSVLCEEPIRLLGKVNDLIRQNQFIVDKPCPYGDGNSAKKIKEILLQELK